MDTELIFEELGNLDPEALEELIDWIEEDKEAL